MQIVQLLLFFAMLLFVATLVTVQFPPLGVQVGTV